MLFKGSELHRGMMVSCILSGVGLFFMAVAEKLIFLGIATFIFSIGMVFLDVFMNICMIQIGEKDVKKYLSLGYFVNSCGNFIGPLLVGILELHALKIFTVGFLGLGVGFFFFAPLK